MTVALIHHPDCGLHDMGPHHPEQPQRLGAISDALIASQIDPVLRHVEPRQANREQLLRVHEASYVDAIFAQSPQSGLAWIDGDTAMNPHSLDAALYAAGAAVAGVDMVMGGEVHAAFCNVRPPGHHAEHARAMGFCLFNNVAVGAAHALATYGLERVAILDFDVHHGNGTEDIFRAEPRVLFCSTFQHPFYPYCGAEGCCDHIVNVPLPAGTGSQGFREAVRYRWLPALNELRPQLVMISAGFDAHQEDHLASLKLTDDDYGWVTEQIRAVAQAHAQGRIVSLLEGGYALQALGRSVARHISALL